MQPISSLSREYVRIVVRGAQGGEVVEVAFTDPSREPAEQDWHPAEWDAVTAEGARARILVGPGAVALPPGTHLAWVRVTAAVEQPVLQAGLVPIT